MTLRRRVVYGSFRRAFLVAVCLLAMTGCRILGLAGAERVRDKEERREASQRQLLMILRENMSSLATLKARARIEVVKQDVLVPAGLTAEVRRSLGKRYRKAFLRTEVNGILLLSRLPEEARKVCFAGSVMGAQASFRLLGVGDHFRITMPNVDRDADEPGVAKGRILVGSVAREDLRPKDKFSVRPQDISDLLLQDEALPILRGDPDVLCYRETWKDFYVLTFLRLDWPDHIFSRIWIERKELHVTIHQIFDRSGEIVAEARFAAYKTYRSRKGGFEVDIPQEIVFIWPRDHLLMEVELSGVKVNERIEDRHWMAKSRPGYQVVPLTIPERIAD